MLLKSPSFFLLLYVADSVLSSCIQGQPCHDPFQGRDTASPLPGADDLTLKSRTLLEATSSAISSPSSRSMILRRAPQGPQYAQLKPYQYAQLAQGAPQRVPSGPPVPQAPATPEIVRGKKIGNGGQGVVHECEYEGHKAALKQSYVGKDMLHEVQMHAMAKGGDVKGHIVGIYTATNRYAVLELCDGDLYNLIKEKYYENKPELIKKDFLQILTGVKSFHDQKIYHRDLKTDNIMHLKGILKISDFGSATEDEDTTRCVTTRSYTPPEFWEGPCRSSRFDIWALGIILLEMVFMELPWKDATQENCKLVRETKGDALREIYPPISDELLNICRHIFTQPEMTINNLIKEMTKIHSFIKPSTGTPKARTVYPPARPKPRYARYRRTVAHLYPVHMFRTGAQDMHCGGGGCPAALKAVGPTQWALPGKKGPVPVIVDAR